MDMQNVAYFSFSNWERIGPLLPSVLKGPMWNLTYVLASPLIILPLPVHKAKITHAFKVAYVQYKPFSFFKYVCVKDSYILLNAVS